MTDSAYDRIAPVSNIDTGAGRRGGSREVARPRQLAMIRAIIVANRLCRPRAAPQNSPDSNQRLHSPSLTDNLCSRSSCIADEITSDRLISISRKGSSICLIDKGQVPPMGLGALSKLHRLSGMRAFLPIDFGGRDRGIAALCSCWERRLNETAGASAAVFVAVGGELRVAA